MDVEKAYHRHEIGSDAGFLGQFAQSGGDQRGVAVLHLAAGKTHLARMARQMLAALGEQYGRFGARDDGN